MAPTLLKPALFPFALFAAIFCTPDSDRASGDSPEATAGAASTTTAESLDDGRSLLKGPGYPCSLDGFAARTWARDSAVEVKGVARPETFTLQLRDSIYQKMGNQDVQRERRLRYVRQTLTLLPDGTYRSDATLPTTPGDASRGRRVLTNGRYLRSPEDFWKPMVVFTGPLGACGALEATEGGRTLIGEAIPPYDGGTAIRVTHVYRR